MTITLQIHQHNETSPHCKSDVYEFAYFSRCEIKSTMHEKNNCLCKSFAKTLLWFVCLHTFIQKLFLSVSYTYSNSMSDGRIGVLLKCASMHAFWIIFFPRSLALWKSLWAFSLDFFRWRNVLRENLFFYVCHFEFNLILTVTYECNEWVCVTKIKMYDLIIVYCLFKYLKVCTSHH